MSRILSVALVIMASFVAAAQNRIKLTSGDKSMTATLVDNEATRTLLSMIEYAPVTIVLNDYGGFEKVGALPQSLPTSDTGITTEPGDIMLYLGSNIVIFYGSNTWSYTRIGKIEGATVASLRDFLGTGSITLTLSIADTSGVDDVTAEKPSADTVYDLYGRPVNRRPLPPGIYIVNGVRTLIQ